MNSAHPTKEHQESIYLPNHLLKLTIFTAKLHKICVTKTQLHYLTHEHQHTKNLKNTNDPNNTKEYTKSTQFALHKKVNSSNGINYPDGPPRIQNIL